MTTKMTVPRDERYSRGARVLRSQYICREHGFSIYNDDVRRSATQTSDEAGRQSWALAAVTLGTPAARVRKECYVHRPTLHALLICQAEKLICQTLHSIIFIRVTQRTDCQPLIIADTVVRNSQQNFIKSAERKLNS